MKVRFGLGSLQLSDNEFFTKKTTASANVAVFLERAGYQTRQFGNCGLSNPPVRQLRVIKSASSEKAQPCG
jgi:hypothetical protein